MQLLKEEKKAAVQTHPSNVHLEDAVKSAKLVVPRAVVTLGKNVSRPALTAVEAAVLHFLTSANHSFAVPLLKHVAERNAVSRAENAVQPETAATPLRRNAAMTAGAATKVTPAAAQNAVQKDGSAALQANAVTRVISAVQEVLLLDGVAVVLQDTPVAETHVALKMKHAQMVPASLRQRPWFQCQLRNPLLSRLQWSLRRP